MVEKVPGELREKLISEKCLGRYMDMEVLISEKCLGKYMEMEVHGHCPLDNLCWKKFLVNSVKN